MNDKIEPALNAAEWAECVSISRGGGDPLAYPILTDPDKAIAWINGNRHDSDPGKITEEDVQNLRALAGDGPFAAPDIDPDVIARTLAGKIAALLPPQSLHIKFTHDERVHRWPPRDPDAPPPPGSPFVKL